VDAQPALCTINSVADEGNEISRFVIESLMFIAITSLTVFFSLSLSRKLSISIAFVYSLPLHVVIARIQK